MGPYRHELFPVYPDKFFLLEQTLLELQNARLLKWVVPTKAEPTPVDVYELFDNNGVRVVATLDRQRGWVSSVFALHNFTGRRAQFHFLGRPKYFGKMMRWVGKEGLDQIFRYFNIETLWSEIPITNRLILKLAKDVGFTEIGVLTNAFNFVNTEDGKFNTVDGVVIQMNKNDIRW